MTEGILDQYRKDKDWGKYQGDFLGHLAGQEEALHEMKAWENEKRSVLLCFQADANNCHRSLIAKILKKEEDQAMVVFCEDILAIFDKHNMNGHIEWKK